MHAKDGLEELINALFVERRGRHDRDAPLHPGIDDEVLPRNAGDFRNKGVKFGVFEIDLPATRFPLGPKGEGQKHRRGKQAPCALGEKATQHQERTRHGRLTQESGRLRKRFAGRVEFRGVRCPRLAPHQFVGDFAPGRPRPGH